jgi:hypothetical protein
LARLFRAERTGAFERRPPATVLRLIERRAALIEQLCAAGARLEPDTVQRWPILNEALTDLVREVGEARVPAEQRFAALQAELRERRDSSPVTGCRVGAGGRLIGRG